MSMAQAAALLVETDPAVTVNAMLAQGLSREADLFIPVAEVLAWVGATSPRSARVRPPGMPEVL